MMIEGSGSGGPKICRSGGSGSGSATLPDSNPLGATFSQISSGDVLYMYIIFTAVWLCLVLFNTYVGHVLFYVSDSTFKSFLKFI
jgi:hypothetical protein